MRTVDDMVAHVCPRCGQRPIRARGQAYCRPCASAIQKERRATAAGQAATRAANIRRSGAKAEWHIKNYTRRYSDPGKSIKALLHGATLVGPVTGLIYLITNTVTKQSYVGSTTSTLPVRWGQHVSNAQAARAYGLLGTSIRDHGPAAFSLVVLAANIPVAELWDLEAFYTEQYNTLAPCGLNLKAGCQGGAAYLERKREG